MKAGEGDKIMVLGRLNHQYSMPAHAETWHTCEYHQ